VEIINDPFLFALRIAPSRDVRIAGILVLFFGAFCSRAIIGVIGSSGALGIVAALRLLHVFAWFFVPSPPAEPSRDDN
jgi:hypothetical protein